MRCFPQTLLSVLVLLGPSPLALGEMVWTEDQETGLTTIRLTVTPADEPRPALRHRLTLRPYDLRPGNSVAYYLRAYPENGPANLAKHFRKKYGEEFDDWYDPEFPLSNFDREKVDTATGNITDYIRDHLDRASRCRDCDWGYHPADLRGSEVYSTLLPEFRSSRSISRLLALHTRVALADRRFDDAINTMRINYRLGHDVGQQPFVVAGLIGIAITEVTNRGVTELIGMPDSPNLYWAVSELPNPPISLRKAIRLEMSAASRIFPFLETSTEVNRSHEHWNALWQAWNYDILLGNTQPSGQNYLALLAGLGSYTHAKERLVDWGHSAEEVEQMAVGQVLSRYSARVYQIASDEEEKFYYAPYSQRQPSEHLEQIGVLSDDPDRELVPIVQLLLPASRAARSAEVRVARNVAALRLIEALRMHAAQNDARLPHTLEEVTCVPIPRNPATDKPFRYHREGKTAVLELPEWEGFPGRSVRYEITIAKPE